MKKCIIICNTFKKDARELADTAVRFLSGMQIDADIMLYAGQHDIPDFSEYECAITLGGDGTVLFAARACAPLSIPIFPVNFGEFGFIAGISKTDWQSQFRHFADGTLPAARRSMVQVGVVRNGVQVFSSLALNEAVVSSRSAARIVTFDVVCNRIPFGKFKADGVIVSTATGSTAYSAAAGGPIVDPAVDALILNPICPFSLSNRPLVLSPSSLLEITLLPSRGTEFVLTCDGQIPVDVQTGDLITVCKYEKPVYLAGCDSPVFYAALRSKLHWSGQNIVEDRQ